MDTTWTRQCIKKEGMSGKRRRSFQHWMMMCCQPLFFSIPLFNKNKCPVFIIVLQQDSTSQDKIDIQSDGKIFYKNFQHGKGTTSTRIHARQRHGERQDHFPSTVLLVTR
jgi:hypothetical protein